MYDSCCVVLVSYNPTRQIVENVNALIPQVAEIFIVDNGSNSDSLIILEELASKKSTSIKYNPTNLGIATALNQGVEYASKRGYEWLVTFDQDSLAPFNYIQTMIDAYYHCDWHELIAIVAPRYQTNIGIISFSRKQSESQFFSKIKTTMTSGNLVKIDTFGRVGLFDDSFFIDYVDHEFCLRVRSKGLSIIESNKSLLFHSLGNSTIQRFMGINIITTGHSPVRRYYKYRNMIKTLKKYYLFEPFILFEILKSLLFEPVKIFLFEEDKFLKVKSIFRGIFDGINRMDS